MWPSILARLLRRRVLCIIILSLLLIFYFLYFLENKSSLLTEQSFQRTRPLIWRTLQEHVLADEPNNRTNNLSETCRNSLQGRLLLVDDRGFVCDRTSLLSTGCCDVEIPETLYYSCESCNTTSTYCCGIYEYCVSCCLHPTRREILEKVLHTVRGRQAAVYARVVDHFELCLVKCRTNSHSVEHENKYRDAKSKYCYGLTEAHESQRAVLESTI